MGEIGADELPDTLRPLLKSYTVILVAECSIDYEGRAASKAGRAYRLIIIKQDGTVLVHESSGREPLNWQPKATVRAWSEEGVAYVEAVRSRPRERLLIKLYPPITVMAARLGQRGLELFGSENDIVEVIAMNPRIVEEGARLVTREARTPYGRADVILRGRDGALIVVEVKRSRADVPAVYQLMRYVEYFRSLGFDVRGYLASPSVTPAAAKALSKAGLRHVRVEPPKRR